MSGSTNILRIGFAVLAASALMFACRGPDGPKGDQGIPGPTGALGPPGIAGPVHEPPLIRDVTPRFGTGRTIITLTGEFFDANAANNHVFFDGVEAEIVSASPTELRVRNVYPSVTDATQVAVTVLTNKQASNAFAFLVVPRGFEYMIETADIRTPTNLYFDVAQDVLWIADRDRGVLQYDPTNAVTRFVLSLDDGLWGPTAMAPFGDGTMLIADRDPVSGYTQILDVDQAGNHSLWLDLGTADVTAIEVDAAGNQYYLDQYYFSLYKFNDAGQYMWQSWFSTSADLSDMALLGNKLYVTDRSLNRIYTVDTTVNWPMPVTILSQSAGDPIYQPQDIVAGPGTTLYFINQIGSTGIAVLDANVPSVSPYGSYWPSWNYSLVTTGAGGELFAGSVYGLDLIDAVGASFEYVVPSFRNIFDVAVSGNDIYAYVQSYGLVRIGTVGAVHHVSSVPYLSQITFDSEGMLVSYDNYTSELVRIDPKTGARQVVVDASDGFAWIQGVAEDGAGTIYVSCFDSTLASHGIASTNLDGTFINHGLLSQPGGATDLGFYDGHLYYWDNGVKRVPVADMNAVEDILPAGAGWPYDYAFLDDGSVYVAAWNRIVEVDPQGRIDNLVHHATSDFLDLMVALDRTPSNQFVVVQTTNDPPLVLVTP